MNIDFDAKPRFPSGRCCEFIGSLIIFGKLTDVWFCHHNDGTPFIRLRWGIVKDELKIYTATLEAARDYDPRIQKLIVYTLF